jgi:heme-degrading monooxygenase HmoA
MILLFKGNSFGCKTKFNLSLQLQQTFKQNPMRAICLFIFCVLLASHEMAAQVVSNTSSAPKFDLPLGNNGSFVQIVKFRSQLPDSAVSEIMESRKGAFLKVPGLLQKYYLKNPNTKEYCGVYMWASEQDFINFRKTELAKSSAKAYQVQDSARVELFEMIYPLRD